MAYYGNMLGPGNPGYGLSATSTGFAPAQLAVNQQLMAQHQNKLQQIGQRQQQQPSNTMKPGGSTMRQPYAWTAAGRQQASQPQGSGNPLLDMLGGSVQTSINPQNIYSPQQTQEAVNQAVASSSMPLPWLQNRMVGRGMNVNSPATIDRAMVPYAQGLAQGQVASAQIPLQDITANAQHYSAGEQAREGEALDWARLLASSQGINQNARLNTLQSVLGLLGSFV